MNRITTLLKTGHIAAASLLVFGMDEAGVGKDAAALRKSDETLMHRGHDLWLATLKWVAEA